jgi:hypothetical protein
MGRYNEHIELLVKEILQLAEAKERDKPSIEFKADTSGFLEPLTKIKAIVDAMVEDQIKKGQDVF